MKKQERNIFNFLYKDSNDQLSELSDDDLKELIDLLKEYKLEYRSRLDLPKRSRFGVEIEIEYANKKKIYDKFAEEYSEQDWYYKPDGTVFQGLEVVSPKLIDSEETWIRLKEVCELLSENGHTGETSSLHIHEDSRIINRSPKNAIKLLKLWAAYENIIFRFGYGEYLNGRKLINDYAYPIAKEIVENGVFNDDIYEDRKTQEAFINFSTDRFQALNLHNMFYNNRFLNGREDKNTIEKRTGNGTTNHIIIQNDINFTTKLINYCNNELFDEDLIKRRVQMNKKTLSRFRSYNDIDIIGSLELADLIFNNNLDKIYFLKQYFKDMKKTSVQRHLVPYKHLTK